MVKNYFVAYLRGVRDYCNAYHFGSTRKEIIDLLVKSGTERRPEMLNEYAWQSRDPNGRINVASALDMQSWYRKNKFITADFPAERLVDQQLIRNEMQIGGYPQPPQSEADAMLRNFRQEHYRSIAQFRAALEKYGITEEQLKQHLLWQLAAVRFTDARFRPIPAPTLPAPSIQTADRLRAGADAPAGNSVDQQMDAWLKTARSQIRIDFKKEAFQ